MKAATYTLFFLLFSLCCHSQSTEVLKMATKKIYDANYTMDFDAVTALTYPKVYEQTGAKKFIDHLDLDYQNDNYRMRLQLVAPVFQYGPIQQIDGGSYCVISYKNPVRYFYENKLDANSSLTAANFLREKDQTKDVTYEPKRNSFNVRRISRIVAIADSSTNNEWRFINLDDTVQRQLLPNILQEEVRKRLGL